MNMNKGPQTAPEGKKKSSCLAPLFDCLRKRVDTDGDGKIEAHEIGDAIETVVTVVGSVTPREGNVSAADATATTGDTTTNAPKKESPRK